MFQSTRTTNRFLGFRSTFFSAPLSFFYSKRLSHQRSSEGAGNRPSCSRVYFQPQLSSAQRGQGHGGQHPQRFPADSLVLSSTDTTADRLSSLCACGCRSQQTAETGHEEGVVVQRLHSDRWYARHRQNYNHLHTGNLRTLSHMFGLMSSLMVPMTSCPYRLPAFALRFASFTHVVSACC